ncbi:putative Ras GTPase-activating-like protein ngap [Diplonema papillatum]|nr:putative Ras GTPase-activating-like protein ngap [Diplonema papillatum]
MDTTPLKELGGLLQNTPNTKRLASEASKLATGLGGKRPSWSVSKNALLDSRRRGSSMKDSGKGDKDEMTRDRRERLQTALLAGKDFDRLELSTYDSFLDDLKAKERQENIPSGDEPVEVLFSASLAQSYTNRTVQRAVCVTKKAVHLLERLSQSYPALISAKQGSHKILWTFDLADLVYIIESRKDPAAVCLDFRVPKPAEAAASDAEAHRKPAGVTPVPMRQSILPRLPDPSYVIFLFNDGDFPNAPPLSPDPMPGKHHDRKSWRERRGLSDKDEFIAVLYLRFWPPSVDNRPKACLMYTELLSLRAADDAQRAISHAIRKDHLAKVHKNMTVIDLMDSGPDDKEGIAQNAKAVRSIRSEGDSKILASLVVHVLSRSGLAKSICNLILTERAVYYTEKDNPENVIRRVELQDVLSIVLEDNGKKDLSSKQWDVLLRIDLANDKSKDFSSDMLFRCSNSRERDVVVHSLQSSYEELVIDKLPVLTGTNIKWTKRGKLEAWLHAPRGSQRKNLLDTRTEEGLRWLVYLLKFRLYDLLNLLTEAVPQEEVHFVGKTMVSLCESAGMTEKLLFEAVNVEMDSSCDVTTIFRGNTLANSMLRSYVGRSVGEYVHVVLVPPLQKFIEKNPQIDLTPGYIDRKDVQRNTLMLWEWIDRFFDSITTHPVESMPHEMRRVIFVICQACIKRKIDPIPYIGGYVMLRVFCPAISRPDFLNVNALQNAKLSRKFLLLAKILQHLANKTLVGEFREPYLAPAINWWLRKMSGSYEAPRYAETIAPPKEPEYRYRGELRERISWKRYLEKLIDKQSAESPADTVRHSFAEIDKYIRDPNFSYGFDHRLLAVMHRSCTNYVEQLLCLLWTETGLKKHRLGELEAELEEMEAGQENDSDNSDLALTPLGNTSLFATTNAQTPPLISPSARIPKSPLFRGRGEDFFLRRSSLWATDPSSTLNQLEKEEPTTESNDASADGKSRSRTEESHNPYRRSSLSADASPTASMGLPQGSFDPKYATSCLCFLCQAFLGWCPSYPLQPRVNSMAGVASHQTLMGEPVGDILV